MLAIVLRFWQLDQYPVGFHIDEASLGYNAYSLLKTARDENGQFLPLHIDMFGDNRPAGYQYLDILPIKIFGLNEFATRFPSALLGALTPVAIFLLLKAIFNKNLPALIAAGLLTISPWHLVISRASAETIVALFFIILGTAFYIRSNGIHRRQLFWATLFFAASLFFYHSSRIFVPLLVIVLSFLQRKRSYFPVLIIIFLSLFLVFGTGVGTSRFQQISIFHFPEIRLVLEEQLREDGATKLPILLVRLFHNKVINYGLGYLKEYFSYFSLNFLFLEGGLPAWYRIPNMGLMYLIELPFLLIGTYLLIKNGFKNRLFWLPLIWLILGPTVAAITRDDVPNVQRSLVMLPALITITSYGLWQCVVLAKHGLKLKTCCLLASVLSLMFIWNFGYFLHQYFVHSRFHRPWYRFNGFKEMVLAVDKLALNYDKILVSKTQGGTYMHFLFFQKIDPRWYQDQGSPKDKDYGGFGKLIFLPQDCPQYVFDNQGVKFLSVASGVCGEEPFTSQDALLIYREDGTVAFRIYPGEGKNE